jgi:peptide/nickel transport system permease protein
VWISFLTVLFSITIGSHRRADRLVRGWTDRIIMAFINALLAFPGLLLALALLAVFGANKYGIILALGLAYTPSVTRIVRGTVLSLREKEFIESSRVLGNSELYTMFRHVLPNCVAPLTVLATSMFGWVILAESSLSFLGLGVPPPAPTWGNMLASARPSWRRRATSPSSRACASR